MVKKILVPIAFSKYSKEILDYASGLAGATKAELLIVNVINERDLEAVDKITSFGYNVDVEKYVETIKNEKREELVQMINELSLPDDKVTYMFCIGDPTDELLKLVIDRDIDLVVMGIRAKEISHIFTGSVAERMFRKCPVPIVSYRGKEIAGRLRQRFERHRSKKD